MPAPHGALHHIELWVGDLTATRRSLGWLLTELEDEQGLEVELVAPPTRPVPS